MYRTVQFSVLLLALTVLTMGVARFYALDSAPRGFYFDEASAANHAFCVSDTGRDSNQGRPLPLFFLTESSGFHSAPYVYVAAAWTTLFGRSIGALRALSAVATTLTIVGLFLLARATLGTRAALFTVVTASLSPWAFQFSRIAWDNPLYPMFLIFGLHLLWTAGGPARAIGSALLFALAMYTYAPARLVAPMIIALVFSVRVLRRSMSWAIAVPFLLVLVVSLYSMVDDMLHGPINDRAKAISLYTAYLHSGVLPTLKLFARQLLAHFSLDFLLLRGDPFNLRHSTWHFGVLSWLDVVGLTSYAVATIVAVRRRQGCADLLLLLPCAYLIALLPSPLTTESVPHALRAIGAWPFVALASGYGLAQLTERHRWGALLVTVLGVAFSTKFLITFFLLYPVESADWFDVQEQHRLAPLDRTALLAVADSTRGRLPHARFYAMSREGISCKALGVTSRVAARPPGILPPLIFQLWISGIATLLGGWLGRAVTRS